MQARYVEEDDMDDDNEEDIFIPNGPTETMYVVIQCSTGTRAQ